MFQESPKDPRIRDHSSARGIIFFLPSFLQLPEDADRRSEDVSRMLRRWIQPERRDGELCMFRKDPYTDGIR